METNIQINIVIYKNGLYQVEGLEGMEETWKLAEWAIEGLLQESIPSFLAKQR